MLCTLSSLLKGFADMFIPRLTDCLSQFGIVLAKLTDDASGTVRSREMQSKQGFLTIYFELKGILVESMVLLQLFHTKNSKE